MNCRAEDVETIRVLRLEIQRLRAELRLRIPTEPGQVRVLITTETAYQWLAFSRELVSNPADHAGARHVADKVIESVERLISQ